MWKGGKVEYLNLGCGPVRYDDHLNLDAGSAMQPYIDIQANMLNLPFKEEVFKGIIASHIFEHLKRGFHRIAFSECWRVLEPNGKLYVEVPDLQKVTEFFSTNYLGRREDWYHVLFGRQAGPYDDHLSGFTQDHLTEMLFGSGFGKLKWEPPSTGYLSYQNQPVLRVTAQKVELDVWTRGF